MVIGIKGTKFSGKGMISAIISDILNEMNKPNEIIAFADSMKQNLSSIFRIPLEYFYNSKRKEDFYINIKTFERDFKNRLPKNKINDDKDINIDQDIFISLRRLMQYYGTDACQRFFGGKIWINSCYQAIKEKPNKIFIIEDVRTENEIDFINSIGGHIINISNQNNIGEHSSERNIEGSFIDVNNEEISKLRESLIKIINKLLNENR